MLPSSLHPRRLARGFTLVELLVVIAIIGMLVALLLPAVQAAREAARRVACQNNLKQIGLAIHNYHDLKERYPPGNVTYGCCCNSRSYMNWTIAILPFIDQGPLADRYNDEYFNEDPVNQFVREQFVAAYSCPSDPDPKKLMKPDSGPGATLQYRRGNYNAMQGRSDGKGWWDSRLYSADGKCGSNIANYFEDPQKQLWKGIFHVVDDLLRPETAASVTDGLSHTIMVGEHATKTRPERATFWAYSYASFSHSAAVPQPRTLLNDYDRCTRMGGTGGDDPCKRGWGSFHGGTVQFLFGDGTVRGLSLNTDMEIFCEQATMAGGEAVGD